MKPSPLDPFFQFKVEDLVILKAQKRFASYYGKRRYDSIHAQVGQVVERTLQECIGGIQANYLVRLSGGTVIHGTGTTPGLTPFNEVELELAPLETEEVPIVEPVDDASIAKN